MRKWQERLGGCCLSVEDIRERLGLPDDEMDQLLDIEKRYPVCVPEYYLDLIDWTDRNDPIRKMCIPDPREFSEGGEKDTSGEADNTVVQGMQHKYSQTALILSTNQCAMYCRHCFRKRLVGLSSEEIAERLPDMARYVSSHPEISNVLISGGDAFLNPDSVIRRYLETFTAIPSIEFIRFGTRTPVTFPFRITEDEGELCAILSEYGRKKHLIVVTQFNHPAELTDAACRAVSRFVDMGIPAMNQSVLLRGVNDDEATLIELSDKLLMNRIKPYYLFQGDPVRGTAHLRTDIERGLEIEKNIRHELSGLGMPQYTADLPGGGGKVILTHCYFRGKTESGRYLFGTPDGEERYYPE